MGIFKKKVANETNPFEIEYNYVKELYEHVKDNRLLNKINELEKNMLNHQKIRDYFNNYKNKKVLLYNLNLVYGDYIDKIDYFLVTKNNFYVINLNNTKLNHHTNILKMIGFSNKKMVDKIIFDKTFDLFYHELVIDDIDNLFNEIMKIEQSSNNKLSSKDSNSLIKKVLKYNQTNPVYLDIVYKDYIDENGNYIKKDDNHIKNEKSQKIKKDNFYNKNNRNNKQNNNKG